MASTADLVAELEKRIAICGHGAQITFRQPGTWGDDNWTQFPGLGTYGRIVCSSYPKPGQLVVVYKAEDLLNSLRRRGNGGE